MFSSLPVWMSSPSYLNFCSSLVVLQALSETRLLFELAVSLSSMHNPWYTESLGVMETRTGIGVIVTAEEDGTGVEGGRPVGAAVTGEKDGTGVEGGRPVGAAVTAEKDGTGVEGGRPVGAAVTGEEDGTGVEASAVPGTRVTPEQQSRVTF